jgi:anion-transporting  ArsA/GET3 family ATPase
MQEFNQRLSFVTGKGGVGKSSIAAAMAHKKTKSPSNPKVLLAEIGDQSYFQELFRFDKPLEYFPFEELPKDFPGLFFSLWTGQDCLKEYARHLLKLESLYKLFFENAIMKTFIQIAPGLPELAIMGKMTSGIRHHGPPLPFDSIVMDSFATGHFLALLKAPGALAQTIKFGPMGEQSRSIDEVLKNNNYCEYIIVCLPEELPTRETIELAQKLRSEFGIRPRVVLNRCLAGTEPPDVIHRFAQTFPQAKDFVDFLEIQKENQEESLSRLREHVDDIVSVPFIFETQPTAFIQRISEHL